MDLVRRMPELKRFDALSKGVNRLVHTGAQIG